MSEFYNDKIAEKVSDIRKNGRIAEACIIEAGFFKLMREAAKNAQDEDVSEYEILKGRISVYLADLIGHVAHERDLASKVNMLAELNKLINWRFDDIVVQLLKEEFTK